MDRKAVTVCANYDLRGWLLDGGPWALLDEILRQAGAQRPELRDRTTSLRREGQQIGRRKSGYSDVASRGLAGNRVTRLVVPQLVCLYRNGTRSYCNRHARGVGQTRDVTRSKSPASLSYCDACRMCASPRQVVHCLCRLSNCRVWPLTGLDLRDAVHLLGLLTNAESDDLL